MVSSRCFEKGRNKMTRSLYSLVMVAGLLGACGGDDKPAADPKVGAEAQQVWEA